MRIALATSDQYAGIGAVALAAYAAFGAASEEYRRKLADAAARATQAELWVATDDDGTVLGSVTNCRPGSPWREIARPGEGEFRMLAVAPAAQGRGVGRALVARILEECAAAGDHAVVLSSTPEMAAAHRLYRALGFTRLPDRDWMPVPGVDLLAFRLDLRR